MTVVLTCYWLAIFIGTHMSPGAAQEFEIEGSDKLKHYVAYAGLAFLLAGWRACRGPLSLTTYVWLFGISAAYGAFDETTQMLVGRDAELGDWFADAIGTLTGLASFAAGAALVRWRR